MTVVMLMFPCDCYHGEVVMVMLLWYRWHGNRKGTLVVVGRLGVLQWAEEVEGRDCLSGQNCCAKEALVSITMVQSACTCLFSVDPPPLFLELCSRGSVGERL